MVDLVDGIMLLVIFLACLFDLFFEFSLPYLIPNPQIVRLYMSQLIPNHPTTNYYANFASPLAQINGEGERVKYSNKNNAEEEVSSILLR